VATNPYENDVTRDNSVFRGLVYSRNGSFQLDANFNGLTVIGALVVPKGKISFNRPSGIQTIYDPKYLRELLVAEPETTPIKLDQVYWRMF
jgi:flagellar basal body rod protein FlgG